jgi:hypothetical protein
MHYYSSGKLRSANQQSDKAGGLSHADKKAFEKACKKGKGVYVKVWKKLSEKERDQLK